MQTQALLVTLQGRERGLRQGGCLQPAVGTSLISRRDSHRQILSRTGQLGERQMSGSLKPDRESKSVRSVSETRVASSKLTGGPSHRADLFSRHRGLKDVWAVWVLRIESEHAQQLPLLRVTLATVSALSEPSDHESLLCRHKSGTKKLQRDTNTQAPNSVLLTWPFSAEFRCPWAHRQRK